MGRVRQSPSKSRSPSANGAAAVVLGVRIDLGPEFLAALDMDGDGPGWTVARIFEGSDSQIYARLIAASDPTITKGVLAAAVGAERLVRRERKVAPPAPSEPVYEPLPLSRQTFASVRPLPTRPAD